MRASTQRKVHDMALLSQSVIGYELTVKFSGIDSNLALVTREQTYELAATTITEADTEASNFLTDLAGMTEADITGHRVTKVYGTVDPVTSVANPYKVAVLSLQPSVIGKSLIAHNVIAPADAVLVDGRVVSPDNAAVIAYLANFETLGFMRLSDGEILPTPAVLVRSRVKSVRSGKLY